MIKVDKEFESLIPPLSDDEFKQLEENCVKEGIRDALVVWKVPNGDQILIDGHNRWKISAKHGGIPFQVKEMTFDLREDAVLWIIDNQLGKRNLQLYDKGVLELKKKDILSEKAKSISRQNLKQFSSDSQKSDVRGRVDEQIGKRIGASRDTVRKIETIEKSGRDDIRDAVKAGDMSINQGYREVKGLNKTNRQAQKELIDSVKQERDDFKEKRESGVVSFGDAVRDRENAAFLAQELYRRCMRLGSQIDTFCMELHEDGIKLAEELKPLPIADKQRLQWQFRNWSDKLLKLVGELEE